MGKAKRVGIWIRVSTEDQVKGESPEHHEKRARLYAEVKGWDVIEKYSLEAVSGKSVMDHPEAKRMLKDIREGHLSGLIFSKLARLARNTRELLDFADIFRESDADLISLQEAIDTSSPAGRLFYTMIAAMAQWEREEIASRVAASVPIRAKLGKPLGGQASFGYRWKGHEFVIDEKEGPVRRLIYETFQRLKRKKSTAAELNIKGYRTRNGRPFTGNTIGRLLQDPAAKGLRRSNYTKSTGDKKHWELKDKSDWILTACPAIVSEDLWNDCNRILDEQYRTRQPGPRQVYLLSGFVYCHCGKKMYVFHTQNEKFYCRACKNRILASDLDEIYHEQLKAFLMTDKDIRSYIEQSNIQIKGKTELLAALQKEADSIRKKMDRLVNMRVNQELTKDSFTSQFKPLEERIVQVDAQLPEVQAEIDFLRIQMNSSDEILHEAKNLYERWPKMDFEGKRSIIEAITEKITIGKQDIQISLSYIPSFVLKAGKRIHNPRDSCSPPA